MAKRAGWKKKGGVGGWSEKLKGKKDKDENSVIGPTLKYDFFVSFEEGLFVLFFSISIRVWSVFFCLVFLEVELPAKKGKKIYRCRFSGFLKIFRRSTERQDKRRRGKKSLGKGKIKEKEKKRQGIFHDQFNNCLDWIESFFCFLSPPPSPPC